MSHEDIQCPTCKRVGQNAIEEDVPVAGHPNVTTRWLICKCGEDIQEVEDEE